MGNAFIVLRDDGAWVAERGGRQSGYQHLIGPYTSLSVAESIMREQVGVTLPIGNPAPGYVSQKAKEAARLARFKWRVANNPNKGKWKQVGGDFGDPVTCGGVWQWGSQLLVLENLSDGGNEGSGYELYEMDLKDLDCKPDSWIKWEQVLDSCGPDDGKMPHSPVWRAMAAASYHGWHEVAGQPETTLSTKRAVQWLRNRDVEIDRNEEEEEEDLPERVVEAWRRQERGLSESDSDTAYLRLGDYGRVDTSWTNNAMEASEIRTVLTELIEALRDWQENPRYLNIADLSVGPFDVASINKRGIIKVGCNKIRVKEVVRFLKEDLKVGAETLGDLVKLLED